MPQSLDRRARRDRLRLASLRENLAARLWPIPVAAIAAAVLLGIGIPLLDDAVDADLPAWLAALLFSGGADAARAVLSAIAGSLVSATTLTFSLTVVALQLASSQASPRVLRMFARDRVVHRTLAVFLGTFAYALGVLRTVQDSEDGAGVPRIAITLAFLLTLASVVTLVLFLAHLARQLRIETVLRDVHRETSATIALVRGVDEQPGEEPGEPVAPAERPETARAVTAAESGFLTASDRERLVELAQRHDLVIAEDRAIGGNVVAGTPVAWWWPRDALRHPETDPGMPDRVAAEVRAALEIGYERTATQDVGFGLRQLVDIAARGVSPGVNDPTTAVHALGHIAAVLSDLARLPDQAPVLNDPDGVPRVIVRRHDFEELLEVGLGQLRHYGAADPEVAARLYGLLREVGWACHRDADRAAVTAQLARLDSAIARREFDDVERARFAGASAAARAALDGRWA